MRLNRKLNLQLKHITVLLLKLLVAVECSQIAGLKLFDLRIYRVAACACIVDCPL